MRFLIDTNIVSYALRRHELVRARIERHVKDGIAVSAVTLAELAFGSLKHPNPDAHRAAWQSFVGAFEVVPFDADAALEHARIRYALRTMPIGERDLLIAAIARPRGLVVVTHNVREFKRVPGLRVQDWVAPRP